MEFNWLNLTGALIIALMMIPNILFAAKNRGEKNQCTVRWALILEQAGRYGCMALMVFPLLVWEFGFPSREEFIVWLALCAALLAAYFVCWSVFFRRPSSGVALWLAILPSAIFILRGAFLHHWLLTAFGVVFAVGHITVTRFDPDKAR